ncbi:MAG: ABC transporter ATP-binding protein [Bacteroidetes bacterium]|nr:ABC transporter ATP-binding protein [Bacteroidota bacterium]
MIYSIVSKIINSKYSNFVNKPFHLHVNDDPSKELTSIISIPYYYSAGIILPITTIISEGVVVLLVLCGICIFDFQIFISIICFLAPIFVIYIAYYKKKLKNISKINEMHQLKLNKIVYETVEGIREILVFNKKGTYQDNIAFHVEELKKINVEYYVTTLVSPKIIELFSIFALVAVVFFSYLFKYNLSYIASFLVLFVISMYRVIPSMNKIMLSINNIRANLFTIEYINKKDENGIKEHKQQLNSKMVFERSFELENIGFQFEDGRKILDNISLTIKKGQSIGIMALLEVENQLY